MVKLKDFVNANQTNSSKNYILVTGHSRGGGIANLVGSKIVDKATKSGALNGFVPFTYTFAAPQTTTSALAQNTSYDSIFNIVNSDDLVPTLPYDF